MFYLESSESLGINEQGHLTVGGCDAVGLAHRYGTPLYVMDETVIRKALAEYKKSIDENYENGGMVAYASKACSFKEIYHCYAGKLRSRCGFGRRESAAMQVGFLQSVFISRK